MNYGHGSRSRVAVACQGGGSHTAFTAGVLQCLMENLPEDVDLVALSGASGGAICATLAWDGLVRNDRKLAVQKLQGFWASNSASEPLDRFTNELLMLNLGLRDLMVMPEVSPYHFPSWGEEKLRHILLQYLNFDELRQLARNPGAPLLRIGAVEVLSGCFEEFRGDEICVECLLASAAIPEFFRAVAVPGRGVYWDGLFSQNPPIHGLIEHQLDELWIVQINPSHCAKIPIETHEILDRRNALSGNLSMEQELGFIEKLNRSIAKGMFKDPDFRPVRVSRIAQDRELGYRSKIDRSPELLEELRVYGQTKCRAFLKERDSKMAIAA